MTGRFRNSRATVLRETPVRRGDDSKSFLLLLRLSLDEPDTTGGVGAACNDHICYQLISGETVDWGEGCPPTVSETGEILTVL